MKKRIEIGITKGTRKVARGSQGKFAKKLIRKHAINKRG